MFPYREKYTESESDVQNNDLLYKITQTCQNTFENSEKIWEFRENQKSIFFKKNVFKMISVLWRYVWPAFGGPKILVYILWATQLDVVSVVHVHFPYWEASLWAMVPWSHARRPCALEAPAVLVLFVLTTYSPSGVLIITIKFELHLREFVELVTYPKAVFWITCFINAPWHI